MSRQHPGATSVVVPAPREAWEQAVASTPLALLTQSARWIDALERIGGWRDVSRAYCVRGGRTLVVPLVEKGHGRLARAASLPHGWGYGGVLASDGHVGPDDLAIVDDDLARYRGARLVVAPSPVRNPWVAGPPAGARWSTAQLTHVRWLADEDDLWGGYSTNVRRSVTRALRLGVEIRRESGAGLLPVYETLRQASVERWARRDGRLLWLDRLYQRASEPPRALAALAAALGEDLVTWVAYVEGRPAAAIVVVRGRDHCLYWRGAMDADLGPRSHANALLHHRAMGEAAAAGHLLYCFGESGHGSSLAAYKEKFGAVPLEWAAHEVGALPVGAALSAAREKYLTASRCLRLRVGAV